MNLDQLIPPDECDVEIYTELRNEFRTHETASDDPTACPDCGAPVKSRKGLNAHQGARGKCPGPKTKETTHD